LVISSRLSESWIRFKWQEKRETRTVGLKVALGRKKRSIQNSS